MLINCCAHIIIPLLRSHVSWCTNHMSIYGALFWTKHNSYTKVSQESLIGTTKKDVPRLDITMNDVLPRYCQLNATLGLFSLGSGEEGAFSESFFAKNRQKTAKKSAQWGKLIKEKL